MSQSLKMVRENLLQFQNGGLSLSDMWDRIDTGLVAMRTGGEETVDPYEDDKAERRTPPVRRGNVVTAG